MEKICIATNNAGKLREVQQMLEGIYQVVSLKDIGFEEDIPEDFDTMEENSKQKATHIYERYQISCFADDSGLEVEALGNAPGVYSARYAGPQKNDADNITLVLKNLELKHNRKARFRTVVTLIKDGVEKQFEGIVNGHLLKEPSGNDGFGYDPIFVPEGYDITFAQMSKQDKNAISHRGQAVRALIEFLKTTD